MKVNNYRVELDDSRHPVLVAEKTVTYDARYRCDSPETFVRFMNTQCRMHRMAEEHTYVVALDTKCKPLGVFEVGHGTVNEAMASPRDIFIRLLLSGAAAFILTHNHPSGEVEPSDADDELTINVKKASEIMKIQMLDHIIIGDGEYHSYNENGFF